MQEVETSAGHPNREGTGSFLLSLPLLARMMLSGMICALQTMLWKEVVIDFGHELVTAIHMPLAWSNERPNAEEYTSAFHRVSISSSKV